MNRGMDESGTCQEKYFDFAKRSPGMSPDLCASLLNFGILTKNRKRFVHIRHFAQKGARMDYRKIIDEKEKKDLESVLGEGAAEWVFQNPVPDGMTEAERVYTMEDIRALPESIRAELTDGRLFIMQVPTTTHQRIIGELYLVIASYIRGRGGDCEAFLSPFGVFLKNDDSTYLLPDLTVICNPEKIEDDGCHGAPDWVIEVTSPSTGKRDYGKKLFMYRSAGVREYWVINSVHRTVMVYLFGKEEEATVYRFEDEILCSIYPDLKFRLADTV